MSRKNALISALLNDAGAIVFTVGEDAGSFTVNPAEHSEELRNRAMVHGYVQKISDAAAIAKSELTGNAKKDAKTKFAAMQSVAERLASGEWSKRSGDGSGPVAGIIYLAFEEWVNNSATAAKKPAPSSEAIRARYDAMSRSEQLDLRNVEAIATIIARIKSERGSKSVSTIDADSLLGELLG